MRPSVGSGDGGGPGGQLAFDPVPVRRRRDDWTAEWQRRFIEVVAETGCVSQAAAAVRITPPRSAYRLAARPDAVSFARAWDAAAQIATRRGVSILHEYAYHGIVETVWKNGECVWERRRPSEKALFFLLRHLDPMRFGSLAGVTAAPVPDPVRAAAQSLAALLAGLEDIAAEDCEAEAPMGSDYCYDADEPAA